MLMHLIFFVSVCVKVFANIGIDLTRVPGSGSPQNWPWPWKVLFLALALTSTGLGLGLSLKDPWPWPRRCCPRTHPWPCLVPCLTVISEVRDFSRSHAVM